MTKNKETELRDLSERLLSLMADRLGERRAKEIWRETLKKRPAIVPQHRKSAAYDRMLEAMWITICTHPEAGRNALYREASRIMAERFPEAGKESYERVLKTKWPPFQEARAKQRRDALAKALEDYKPSGDDDG